MSVESLGELIVSFGADLTNLNKGLGDAQSKVTETATKISDITNKMGLAFAVTGAAITAGLGLMVKSTVEYNEEMLKTSERTGVAIETLSKLKFVADQTESSFEAVANGLKFLQRNTFEAINGNQDLADTFEFLGVQLKDVNGQTRDTEKLFLDLADRFTKIQDPAQKTAIAMQIFGRSGAELIPILNLGSRGIADLSAEAEKLGIVLTRDNAVAIDQFGDKAAELKNALGGLFLTISVQLMPMLTELANKSAEFAKNVIDWANENKDLVQTLAQAAFWLGVWFTTLGVVVPLMGQLVLLTANLGKGLAFLSGLSLFGLTTSVAVLVKNIGWMATAVPILGAAFAGWSIGNLIAQIPIVDQFLNKVMGVPTENRAMRNGKPLTAEESRAVLGQSKTADSVMSGIGDANVNEAGSTAGGGDFLDMKKQKLEKFLSDIQQMSLKQLMQEKQNQQQSVNSFKSVEEQKTAILAQQLQVKQTMAQQDKNIQLASLDFASQMVQAFAGQSKAAYFILKAIRIAEILVNTAAADMLVTAQLGIFAPPAIAANHTLAALSIATVIGTAIAGFAEGTDTIPAMLSPGEMVVPRTFSDAIRAGDLTLGRGGDIGFGGGGDAVTINMYATITHPVDIDAVAKEIAFKTNRELRYIRNR